MTQPDKPVPARGARPQLFGEPTASTSSKSRQPDFGPSILATIDGKPRRETRVSHATPLTRVLWMSALALAVVAVYFAVKFGMLPDASSVPSPSVVAAPAPVPKPSPTVEPVVAAVAPVVAAASASDGAASIENVAVAPASAASSTEQPTTTPNVAASPHNIQQALAKPGTAEPQKVAKPVAPKEPVAVPKASAAPKDNTATARAAPAPKPSAKTGNDGDAELLAAMLPHLKRRGTTPTSPAYEKRCGQLSEDAAVECRAKFCNGREGVDAACPSAVGR
jgi:hypothetical protein